MDLPEEEKKFDESRLEDQLGRSLQDGERRVLEVLQTVLAQEQEGARSAGAQTTASLEPPPALIAARRLLDALRAATDLAEVLSAIDNPSAEDLKSVLKHLTPELQEIALSANALVDLATGQGPPKPSQAE